jgi:hypothetical protein
MKAESYEAVTRVGGSFAQFRRGMDLLVGRNIPFIVTGALLPPNRSEIEEFESWALSIPWMRRPPPYSMCFDLRKRRDNPEKNRLIESLRVSPDDILAMLKRRPESERRLWMEFCRNHMKLPGDRLFRCSGNRAGCVDAYGRFQACMLLCARE